MRIGVVEGVDEISSVREILGGFPRPTGNRPVLPMNKVLDLAAVDARVENGVDFELLLAVDNDRRRRVLDTARDVVLLVRLQKGDVEHRVDLHRDRKLEAERCFADLGRDGERAKTLVVELVARSYRGDVSS